MTSYLAVQRHDQRALLIEAIHCRFLGSTFRRHVKFERQRDQEGQGNALVGPVPFVQDRHEE